MKVIGGYVENWKTIDTNVLSAFNTIFYAFLTLDPAPNPGQPRNLGWDGNAIYETMTRADVKEVMGQYAADWENPHNWQAVKIKNLQSWSQQNGKKFIWALGGWSDLTQTISESQVEPLTDLMVEILQITGADGWDFDWEHLADQPGGESVLGKTIFTLRNKMNSVGLSDKWITLTLRYNMFFPREASSHAGNGVNFLKLGTNGEALGICDQIVSLGGDPSQMINYAQLMAYDISAKEAFGSSKDAWTYEESVAVLQQTAAGSSVYGFTPDQIVFGFEPASQAYTGVWACMEQDKQVMDWIAQNNFGGSMWWSANDPVSDVSCGTGRTQGDLSQEEASYAQRIFTTFPSPIVTTTPVVTTIVTTQPVTTPTSTTPATTTPGTCDEKFHYGCQNTDWSLIESITPDMWLKCFPALRQVSASNGTDILVKGDEANHGLSYFKQAALKYPGFCSTRDLQRNIIEFAIFVGHANQETMKYPAVAEMIDGEPSLDSFYGKGVHQLTYANNYIESTMSTKDLNGNWDPTLQNWFNMQLGTEGLYGQMHKGEVDCSVIPCKVNASEVTNTQGWTACVEEKPFIITDWGGNKLGEAVRAGAPYGVSKNLCLDITAPATDPVIFWEVGIAYAMNKIMKSTTSNLDQNFYEGKWEFATEHNIIQDPIFFPIIDSTTVGNMLAETTKVINGTVECAGNSNLTHRGRYCGFMNGLNAILSSNMLSISWDPTQAVQSYTANCEGSSSIPNYSQLQTYCTDNTRSGGGIPVSVDLTWTNFSQSPSTTTPSTTTPSTTTPSTTASTGSCVSLVSHISDSWCKANGCGESFPEFCTPLQGGSETPTDSSSPVVGGDGTKYWNHSMPWCDQSKTWTVAQTANQYINDYKNGSECVYYEGQKAGGYAECEGGCSNDTMGTAQIPAQDPPAIRKDVEGCCWWGRGAIQTTGPCNFGKLNFALTGKHWKGWSEGTVGGSDQGYTRTGMSGSWHDDCNQSTVGCGEDSYTEGHADFNLCRNPELICSKEPGYSDLKWIAGLFYWVNEPQNYKNSADSNWVSWQHHLESFVQNNLTNNAFIDPISKIVNRGDTQTLTLSGGAHRRQCFEKVLSEIGYPTNLSFSSTSRDGKVKEIVDYLKSSNLGKSTCGSSTDHGVFCYDTGTSDGWTDSTVYKVDDFLKGLENSLTNGFVGDNFNIGSTMDYALASVAAFLAQCMHETIQYNACDENNWSINLNMVDKDYPASAACGQLNQDYQEYSCSEVDKKYQCPGDFQMIKKAETNAQWYGAPGPLFCAPNSALGLEGTTTPSTTTPSTTTPSTTTPSTTTPSTTTPSTTVPVDLNGMVNCYIDTSESNFENGDCTNNNPETCYGADIVHNTFLYSDPWACRVNCPNNDNRDVPFWEECHNKCVEWLTGSNYDLGKYEECLNFSNCSGDRSAQGARNLLEGSACEAKFNKRLCGPGEDYDTAKDPTCFEWNATKQTCFLNGNGYPLTTSSLDHCTNQQYDVSKEELDYLQKAWLDMKCNYSTPVYTRPKDQPTDENDVAYLVNITLQDGQMVQAALAFGHGVLDGKCGSCFLIENNGKYVVLLAVDSRSWSLEISTGANLYLAQDNVGGTCYIPKVKHIDPNEIIRQVTGGSSQTNYICSASDFPNIDHVSSETSGKLCTAVPGNSQGATDAHCEPCGSGQTWWPCDVPGLCECEGSYASPTTPPPTTPPPTTPPPTTPPPTTPPPTTPPPTTPPPTTPPPTTPPPTTAPPTTAPPTTAPPTTQPPTTQPPTTPPPTTAPLTTAPPTTAPPTTAPPATAPPTTVPPTTELPTIAPPTTEPPTTQPVSQGEICYSVNPAVSDEWCQAVSCADAYVSGGFCKKGTGNVQPVNASCVGCCSIVSNVSDDWCKAIGTTCDVDYPGQCMKV